MPKLEPYSRKLEYSYQLGVFPALMLLEAKPDCASRLLLNSQGLENEGVVKLRQRCAALGVRVYRYRTTPAAGLMPTSHIAAPRM